MAQVLKSQLSNVQIIMCILSNYTPECLVECYVECPIEELGIFAGNMGPDEFADKFATAVKIAEVDPHRAVTHNKGIMNGIDAVVLATGNDFRAIEACAHAFASRDGQYRSLSSVTLHDGIFRFSLKIPLAVGTVGGLTSLHPLAKTSLEILNRPSAVQLMQVMAAVGLAQNFGAVRSLVTTGIQRGHMKLHLLNIMNQLNATDDQVEMAKNYFTDKIVSYTAARNFLQSINQKQ
jgi:hydroxymethylglutaryl-CoA reductase